MSQEPLTDDEGFSNEEKIELFKLGFDDGDLEYLYDKDIEFNTIKNAYMRILPLPEYDGFGIDDVTYEQLMADDNYLIPNHPDVTRNAVAKKTMDDLLSGGRRRKRKTRRTRKTRKTRRTRRTRKTRKTRRTRRTRKTRRTRR